MNDCKPHSLKGLCYEQSLLTTESKMEANKTYSFTTAMLDYFGKLPGQSTMDFAQELKGLSDADRAEFRAGLIGLGYKLV